MPDSALDLHQLHCRYAILWGADMAKANELWAEMKGHYSDRKAHLAALAGRLRPAGGAALMADMGMSSAAGHEQCMGVTAGRLHVLVGDRSEDLRLISTCPDGGSIDDWIVPKTAIPGDRAVVFILGHGFLARALVSGFPAASTFGGQIVYRSDLRDMARFPVPVPLAYVMARIPRWGWLDQRTKSCHTPDEAVASALWLALLDYQVDFEGVEGPEPEKVVSEGTPSRCLAIRYERSATARYACIRQHGSTCAVCGFDFGAVYGPIMDGFILVHHLEMIATDRKARDTNPARDMRPVCANCHYVMHRRDPPFTVEETRRMLRAQAGG